jgi:hypothetical protein
MGGCGRPSKKAWRSIYDKVRDSGIDVLPDETNDAENGDRGKEKKQRLLTYVREHPEELRPVDMKSLRRSKESAQV